MRNLYPRLAATNLKKNRRFYLPYLLACIVIVALFCIILTLASDPYLGQMQHGGSVSQVLGFGVSIMALFSAIILFYTNSTFTKQRKREFAIYNILGMEKRHISYVLFWESLYTAAMALFFGLVAAGVFSKLLQLVLMRLIGGEATFGLNIRLMSIGYTVVFFGALFLLLLLNTIRIIHLSNPVQLLRAGSEGEREPRSKWILALLGAVCLAAGYIISLRASAALYAIQYFFPAVILVIIGTYLTFIALSVVVLKALRKNRRYYYKTSHFATVSGLIYRMSRNAAGLASICILSTMVLVTVSTTVSLYKGVDAYADVRWPQDMTLTLMTDPRTNTVPDVAPVLRVVDDTMTRTGLTQSNVHGYRTVRFSALRSGDALDLTSKQLTGSSADEYTVMVLDTEGYAGLTGEQVTLAPGEALAWTDGAAFGDTLTLGGDTLRLRPLDSFSLVSGSSIMGLHTLYLVMPDLDSVLELRAQQNAYTNEHGGTRSMLNYTYQFDLSGTDNEQLDALHALLSDPELESAAVAANVNYTTDMRADGYPTLRSTYGGFLFLGFFLGFVFLFATVLIIYYKQVSEGYDDRGRFRIMQQVGMTPKEVKATIRTQVLLMFFLPLVTAAIHIAFAFPLIKQIVFAFGLQNVHLFFAVHARHVRCLCAAVHLCVPAHGAHVLPHRAHDGLNQKKSAQAVPVRTFFVYAASAPEGGQHGDDLLLAAHHAGQEHGAVLWLDREGGADRVVIADVEQVRALHEHVRDHKRDHVIVLLLELRGHDGQQLVLALEHLGRVERRDLTDAEIVVGDVEFLEVGKAQLLGRLVAGARGGEDQVAQLLE